MPIVSVNDQELEFPDDMSNDEIKDVLRKKFPQQRTNVPSPQEPLGFFGRVNQDILNRGQKVGESLSRTGINPIASQTPIETLAQVGGQGAGLVFDVGKEAAKSFYDYTAAPIVKKSFSRLGQAIFGSDTAKDVADTAAPVLGGISDYLSNHPRLAGNLEAGSNLAGFYTPVGKTSLADITAATPGAIVSAGKKVGSAVGNAAVDAPLAVARGTYDVADKVTDYVAGGISNKLNRMGVSKDILFDGTGAQRGNADVLFLKTLQQEGVPLDTAIAKLKQAKDLGATPSVAVTSNIPQMQRQGFMTSQSSAGSKVAADALNNIKDYQIPNLNDALIKVSTGGGKLGAEEYGAAVAKEAKAMVEAKALRLKTRAQPFYSRSVGVDKSVPIENDLMKKALENPVVVKGIQEWRTNPYTLANVKKELTDLGVSAPELETLPINSTVTLHAARTHLRGLRDAAFSSGDSNAQRALKGALDDIDNAIESTYPDYKVARRIYSEDAGALKSLKDSPVGKMATFADGNYSKIANDLMSKDPQYIKKFVNGANQKMRDSIAGAFLSRQLEEAAQGGMKFSDKVFGSQGNAERLRALVGEDRFNQMQKIDTVIDELIATRGMAQGSMTAANQGVQDGVTFPTDKAGILDMVRQKIAPSLFELVRRDPIQAKRYNELLFSDEGYKLLDSISKGNKATGSDIEKIGSFLNKNATNLTKQVKRYIKDESGSVNFDYMMRHRPPNFADGARLDDMTGGGKFYPSDIYSDKAMQYYGTGDKISDAESMHVIMKAKGRPEMDVTIYRAVPNDLPDIINSGDWVSLSKNYAKNHGMSNIKSGYKILSKKVKVKNLTTNADSINEFGYWE